MENHHNALITYTPETSGSQIPSHSHTSASEEDNRKSNPQNLPEWLNQVRNIGTLVCRKLACQDSRLETIQAGSQDTSYLLRNHIAPWCLFLEMDMKNLHEGLKILLKNVPEYINDIYSQLGALGTLLSMQVPQQLSDLESSLCSRVDTKIMEHSMEITNTYNSYIKELSSFATNIENKVTSFNRRLDALLPSDDENGKSLDFLIRSITDKIIQNFSHLIEGKLNSLLEKNLLLEKKLDTLETKVGLLTNSRSEAKLKTLELECKECSKKLLNIEDRTKDLLEMEASLEHHSKLLDEISNDVTTIKAIRHSKPHRDNLVLIEQKISNLEKKLESQTENTDEASSCLEDLKKSNVNVSESLSKLENQFQSFSREALKSIQNKVNSLTFHQASSPTINDLERKISELSRRMEDLSNEPRTKPLATDTSSPPFHPVLKRSTRYPVKASLNNYRTFTVYFRKDWSKARKAKHRREEIERIRKLLELRKRKF